MLARYQFTVTDAAGNILPGAVVTVRNETTGAPLAILYSDRAGTTPLGNPITTDVDGFIYFHVAGGAYKITAVSGSTSREWRYVGIGLAQENDALTTGINYLFSSTTSGDPGPGYMRLNNAIPASVTHIYFDNLNVQSADLSTWLAGLDDLGNVGNRGVIVLQNSNGSVLFVGKVTGSIVDNSGYYDVTVTHLASTGTFTAGESVSAMFMYAGAAGDVAGPAGATDGHFASFDGATGKLIKDSGSKTADFAVTAIGQGKQTIYVPASAMVAATTNGAASGTQESTTNKVMQKTLNFDPTTQQFAQFAIAFPKQWNLGTVTFTAYWSHPATSTNFGVVWALQGIAVSNAETFDTAFGTEQTSTDTGGNTDYVYVSPESSAITIGGTPAAEDIVYFRVKRVPADGSDTMAVAARLIGIKLYLTTNAVTDA